jgi:hypothetical protein
MQFLAVTKVRRFEADGAQQQVDPFVLMLRREEQAARAEWQARGVYRGPSAQGAVREGASAQY